MCIFVKAMAEDAVCAAIIARLLKEFGEKYRLAGDVKIKGGKGNIDKELSSWNQAAATTSVMYFVLRDLDTLAYPQDERYCPQTKAKELLLPQRKHKNLLLRFAVAEAENWLLADIDRLRKFLGATGDKRIAPDEILKGKEAIISIAGRSRKREYKEHITLTEHGGQGPDYNEILKEFIETRWNPRAAAKNSKSLRRTLERLKTFNLQPPARR